MPKKGKTKKQEENVAYIVIYKDGDSWDCAREDDKEYIKEYDGILRVIPVWEQTPQEKKQDFNLDDYISHSNTVEL